jgi:hypothetical protein
MIFVVFVQMSIEQVTCARVYTQTHTHTHKRTHAHARTSTQTHTHTHESRPVISTHVAKSIPNTLPNSENCTSTSPATIRSAFL